MPKENKSLKWMILDNLPSIFVILVFTFGMVMAWNNSKPVNANPIKNENTLGAMDKFFECLGDSNKFDTYEYEDLAVCIRSDQVPASEIAELFTDKAFYKWYSKKYFNKGEKV